MEMSLALQCCAEINKDENLEGSATNLIVGDAAGGEKKNPP